MQEQKSEYIYLYIHKYKKVPGHIMDRHLALVLFPLWSEWCLCLSAVVSSYLLLSFWLISSIILHIYVCLFILSLNHKLQIWTPIELPSPYFSTLQLIVYTSSRVTNHDKLIIMLMIGCVYIYIYIYIWMYDFFVRYQDKQLWG